MNHESKNYLKIHVFCILLVTISHLYMLYFVCTNFNLFITYLTAISLLGANAIIVLVIREI